MGSKVICGIKSHDTSTGGQAGRERVRETACASVCWKKRNGRGLGDAYIKHMSRKRGSSEGDLENSEE